MKIPSFQRQVQAANLPLEKLATSTQLSQSEKIGEVSRQFEAVLLRQILGEAQKPVFRSKMSGASVANDIHRDMVTKELADQISRSGAIGLGRSMEAQLKHQLKTVEKPGTTVPNPSAVSVPRPPASQAYD